MIPHSATQAPLGLTTLGHLTSARAAVTGSSRLLDAFEHRLDEVALAAAGPVLTLMQAYPAYRRADMAGQLFEQAREHARLVLQLTRTGCPPSAEELEFARQVGARRATGTPLAAVMHGYRVGGRFVFDWIASEAGSDAQDLRAALSLTASAFEYGRAVASVVAVGYLQQRESLTLSSTDFGAQARRGGEPARPRNVSDVLLIPTLAADLITSGYLARLSPRERELLDLVARGLTNKEIAHQLRISLYTTKEYMSRILEKTSLPSRAAVAAVYVAARQGFSQ
jgi:DNA-binding NarL/FixJ family response regulator